MATNNDISFFVVDGNPSQVAGDLTGAIADRFKERGLSAGHGDIQPNEIARQDIPGLGKFEEVFYFHNEGEALMGQVHPASYAVYFVFNSSRLPGKTIIRPHFIPKDETVIPGPRILPELLEAAGYRQQTRYATLEFLREAP